MLNGLMMQTQLTTSSIMKHSDKVFSKNEIVSCVGNEIHRCTYGEAFKRTRKLANALQSFGINSGDRIGTLAWNDYRHFELYFGIPGIGAVCHTINPRLFPEQINFIVNHAKDRMLFTDPMFVPLLEKLQSHFSSVEQIVVLCDESTLPESSLKNVCSYEAFIEPQSDEFDWPEIDENTASSLCYTSGTTGNPKGVLYSHRSVVLHSYASALPDAMNLSVNDVVMPIVPMFHVNAWGAPFATAMVGSKLVLPGPKMGDGQALQGLIETEKVNYASGVPTIWLALLAYLKQSGSHVESLKRIVVGGAACPTSIMEQFKNDHDVDVINAWGMTETSPLGTVNSTVDSLEHNLSAEELLSIRAKQGRPIYGVEVELLGSDGQVLPWDGESAGEINIRGPWVCNSYYKLDDSDAYEREGWFRTGDIATIDESGCMHITDRVKDVIKSGGEWISSIELENAAMGHPQVKEAAVIGITHPKWSERPLLVIVKEAGEDLETKSVMDWLGDKVAKWWMPDDVVYVDELPHTATAKVSKKDLREQFKDYRFPTADD